MTTSSSPSIFSKDARHFLTTLSMNVPYCSLMMMSNESLKRWLNPSGEFNLGVYLLSGVVFIG